MVAKPYPERAIARVPGTKKHFKPYTERAIARAVKVASWNSFGSPGLIVGDRLVFFFWASLSLISGGSPNLLFSRNFHCVVQFFEDRLVYFFEIACRTHSNFVESKICRVILINLQILFKNNFLHFSFLDWTPHISVRNFVANKFGCDKVCEVQCHWILITAKTDFGNRQNRFRQSPKPISDHLRFEFCSCSRAFLSVSDSIETFTWPRSNSTQNDLGLKSYCKCYNLIIFELLEIYLSV
jgi:hypothetical protein